MKTSSLVTDKKGFTIIEVVLVLAIAGLIFLVVFLALPQLQRSQRNSDRRQTAGRLVAAVNEYTTNNNGQFPVDSTTGNPDLGLIVPEYAEIGSYSTGTAALDTFELQLQMECNDSNAPVTGSARSFVILTELEGGSTPIDYCVDG